MNIFIPVYIQHPELTSPTFAISPYFHSPPFHAHNHSPPPHPTTPPIPPPTTHTHAYTLQTPHTSSSSPPSTPPSHPTRSIHPHAPYTHTHTHTRTHAHTPFNLLRPTTQFLRVQRRLGQALCIRHKSFPL